MIVCFIFCFIFPLQGLSFNHFQIWIEVDQLNMFEENLNNQTLLDMTLLLLVPLSHESQ